MKDEKILSYDGARIMIVNDGQLLISTGKSRFEKHWHNTKIAWSVLLKKLSESQVTEETHAEYMKLPKDKQDRIKDIGGFVGGHLKDGQRRNGNVEKRQIITLDLDFAPVNLWTDMMDSLAESPELDFAMALYSTHKYSDKTPRYRLIIPIDEPVTPDEYEAIARKVAEKIGIDYFDDTTFQPTRLMYWPSNSSDVKPVFEYMDAEFLSARKILNEYPDWTDVSYWPYSSRVDGVRKKELKKQGDPTEKKGLVGTFCRTYDIPAAIAKFLPDVYVPTDKADRYTFAGGSTAAGLVLYEDGKFAFSNHGTDPASGQLCNAFDLVRLHKFADLDAGIDPDTNITDRPSYKEMLSFASDDENVRIQKSMEVTESAADDFGSKSEEAEEQPKDAWRSKLQMNEKGNYVANAKNCLLILENDPKIQGIALNELSGAVECQKKLPWSRQNKFWYDSDDAQLFMYVSTAWQINFTEKIFLKAFTKVVNDRRFNPLKDYVKNLPKWDGVERVDRLLIDYLGADDTAYTRAVTRKSLVGCINRVLNPGCKFDTVLVLDGKPGIGKSTLLARLGGDWFSDSLSLADTRDKTAAEKIQGCWIMEIGEMQGTKKADVDILKGFLSRQVDEYRPAYGRVVERHPRTCVIFGTTNTTTGFLRDITGNRRFWPVPVEGGTKSVWSMTDAERDQIWSEAAELAVDEETYLTPELEAEAQKMQQQALEYDDREGLVIEYLETKIPDKFYDWDTFKRVDYFQSSSDELQKKEPGTVRRDRVSAQEIYCECFGRPRNTWKKTDGYEIAAIMARLPEWERTGERVRIAGYGQQRVYTGKKVNNVQVQGNG